MIARADVAMGAARDDTLFPAVLQLLEQHHIHAGTLAAIVCGSGPGSFTSLRISASLAKGLAYAAGCPLFAVSSLTLAAAAVTAAGRYIVHSDALRGERYAQAVEVNDSGVVSERGPIVRVPFDALSEFAQGRARLAVLTSPDEPQEARLVVADAAALLRCADWSRRGPVDLDSWEPAYGRLAEAQVKWEEAHGQPLPQG
jgi:tRNA threonylcarbamoyl adenosine modification protein YeaZ